MGSLQEILAVLGPQDILLFGRANAKHCIQLMSSREGNTNSRKIREKTNEHTLKFGGNQNSLFPVGIDIKCFVIQRGNEIQKHIHTTICIL